MEGSAGESKAEHKCGLEHGTFDRSTVHQAPSPPVPTDEEERLKELYSYEILDTEAEVQFNDIVALLAKLLDTPIALVSLVDRQRQWFKAKVGLDATCTSRQLSFCARCVASPTDMLIVNDTWKDCRFAKHDLVTGAPFIRFYAGAPLLTPSGRAVGTLCAIDVKPRQLTELQAMSLRVLSEQVVAQLELRLQLRTARHQMTALETVQSELIAAKRKAEQASRAKSQFLANMSHEIRTPLNAVIGYAQLLEAELDAKQLLLPSPKSTGRKNFPTLAGPQPSPPHSTTRLRGNRFTLPTVFDFSSLSSESSHETPSNTAFTNSISKYVHQIRQGGMRLLDVINSILDFSKIEAHKFEVRKETMNVHDLLRSVVELNKGNLSHKGVLLECDIGSDVPAIISADRPHMTQIIMNLLGNAIKFTKGGRHVTLNAYTTNTSTQDAASSNAEQRQRTRRHLSQSVQVVKNDCLSVSSSCAGTALPSSLGISRSTSKPRDMAVAPAAAKLPCLVIEINDEGLGIPLHRVEAIFEPFEQADNTTTREYGGTGLGLAIVKRLVALLGGSLTVESAPGEGSCFCVAFPLELPAESVQPTAKFCGAGLHVLTTATLRGALDFKGTIVLAEDDKITQRLLLQLFKKLGVADRVTILPNCKLALEKTIQQHPTLVFLDMHTPEMDGVEAHRLIRAYEDPVTKQKPFENLPIYALSADAFIEQQNAAIAAGFTGYLTKPIDFDSMIKVLQAHSRPVQ